MSVGGNSAARDGEAASSMAPTRSALAVKRLTGGEDDAKRK